MKRVLTLLLLAGHASNQVLGTTSTTTQAPMTSPGPSVLPGSTPGDTTLDSPAPRSSTASVTRASAVTSIGGVTSTRATAASTTRAPGTTTTRDAGTATTPPARDSSTVQQTRAVATASSSSIRGAVTTSSRPSAATSVVPVSIEPVATMTTLGAIDDNMTTVTGAEATTGTAVTTPTTTTTAPSTTAGPTTSAAPTTTGVATTPNPDPWVAVTYSVDSNGDFVLPSPDKYNVSGVTFDSNACLDVNGHAVVVHAPNGTRVGCGVLGLDIWATTTITSDAAGTVNGDTVTVPGYAIEDSGVSMMNSDMTAYNAYGRAIVVHASDGTRVACGCCVEEGVPVALDVYPDYDGSIIVSGNVTVTSTTAPAQIVMAADLTGLETSATSGLHIHTGTSCTAASSVGGHLFDAGVAVIGKYPDYDDDAYAVSGTACVVAVDGADGLDGAEALISFSAMLVDDNDSFEAGDTGGVHIHVGTSCDVAANVGGHFYDPVCTTTTATVSTTVADGSTTTTTTASVPIVEISGTIFGLDEYEQGTWSISEATTCVDGTTHSDYVGDDMDNPFTDLTYAADADGEAIIDAQLEHYSLVDEYAPYYLTVEGHALVLYDESGTPRACGIIEAGQIREMTNLDGPSQLVATIEFSQEGVALSPEVDGGTVALVIIVLLLVLGGGGGFAYYWFRIRTDKAVAGTRTKKSVTSHTQNKKRVTAGVVVSDPALKSSTSKNYKVQHAVTVEVADGPARSKPKPKPKAKTPGPSRPPAAAKPATTVKTATKTSAPDPAVQSEKEETKAGPVAASIQEWLQLHKFDAKYEQILLEAGIEQPDDFEYVLLADLEDNFDKRVAARLFAAMANGGAGK